MKVFFVWFFATLACQVVSAATIPSLLNTDKPPGTSSIYDSISDLKKLNDYVANRNISNKKLQSLVSHVFKTLQTIINQKNVLDEVVSPRNGTLSPFNAAHKDQSVVIKKTTFANEKKKSLVQRDIFENPNLKDFIRKNPAQVRFEPEENRKLSPRNVKNHFNSYSKELYEINHPIVRDGKKGLRDPLPPIRKTPNPIPRFTVKYLKPINSVTKNLREIGSLKYNRTDSQPSVEKMAVYAPQMAINRKDEGKFLDAMFDDNISEINLASFTPQQQKYLRNLQKLQQEEMEDQ